MNPSQCGGAVRRNVPSSAVMVVSSTAAVWSLSTTVTPAARRPGSVELPASSLAMYSPYTVPVSKTVGGRVSASVKSTSVKSASVNPASLLTSVVAASCETKLSDIATSEASGAEWPTLQPVRTNVSVRALKVYHPERLLSKATQKFVP